MTKKGCRKFSQSKNGDHRVKGRKHNRKISVNNLKSHQNIFCRKLDFEGPTNLFLKRASKSVIQL